MANATQPAKTETKPNDKPPTVANGAVSAPADAKPVTAGEGEEKGKTRGVIPTMPICVVYGRQDGKTVAAIVNPKGERFEVVGRGQGSAMGELTDLGFHLSTLKATAPEWATSAKIVPEGATVVGYATISGFPLPNQD